MYETWLPLCQSVWVSFSFCLHPLPTWQQRLQSARAHFGHSAHRRLTIARFKLPVELPAGVQVVSVRSLFVSPMPSQETRIHEVAACICRIIVVIITSLFRVTSSAAS